MSSEVELKEMDNNLEVVGTLKSNDLQAKQTKSGKDAIMGNVVVAFKDEEGNTQNIRLSVYVAKFKKDGTVSKLYKSMNTVMTEYKDSDKFGQDEADLIEVTGSVSGNEYFNNNNELQKAIQLRGVFFTRLDKDTDVKPHALATIEALVKDYQPVLDADGLPTGDLEVEAYTVGYNGTIQALYGAVIKSDLAETFQGLYTPGSTGNLTFKVNNFAKEDEPDEADVAETHGFGTTEKVENTFTSFESNLQIVGGDIPLGEGLELDDEQIQEIEDRYNRQLLEIQPSTTVTPHTGFGSGSTTTPKQAPKAPVDSSDIPDF